MQNLLKILREISINIPKQRERLRGIVSIIRYEKDTYGHSIENIFIHMSINNRNGLLIYNTYIINSTIIMYRILLDTNF